MRCNSVMTTRQRALRRWLAAASLCVLAACGKGDGKKDEIAKAFSGPPVPTKEGSEKGMAELKAKAEAQALQARTDELDKITELPAQVPDLEAACADAGAAFDEFKTKRIEAAELERWNATKEPDIRKIVEACKTNGDAKIAACQATAYRGASMANFGPDSDYLLIEHCNKRWGGGTPPAAAG
jgi:hypothetical protein